MKRNSSYRYPKTVRENGRGTKTLYIKQREVTLCNYGIKTHRVGRENANRWPRGVKRVGELEATRIVDFCGRERGQQCTKY